jgi:hypothetical protein
VDGNADLSGKVWILKRIREMEAIDAIIPQNLMLARLFFFIEGQYQQLRDREAPFMALVHPNLISGLRFFYVRARSF